MKSNSFIASLLLQYIVIFSCNISVFVPFVLSLCHDNERVALLRLKDSFVIRDNCELSDSKLSSWRSDDHRRGRAGDCCSWRGISCRSETGHVISLNLSNICHYGSINSSTLSSSLLNLPYLEELDLSRNNFNNSPIPFELGRLSKLTHLDLSSSFFAGKIPSEISNLTKLSSLYLGDNMFSSEVPSFFANLSSLTSLDLRNCGLNGNFPNRIFDLPKLELLVLTQNPKLSGSLPEFRIGGQMKKLMISNTSFRGKVPDSIGNLDSLEYLSVARAKFSGLLPSSLGKLTKLTHLDFTSNDFNGPVPSFLRNLTELKTLWFGSNQLTGQIPTWIGDLKSLTVLSLARNNLSGTIPDSLSRLTNLKTLNLYENKLEGTVNFELLIRDMKSLAELRFDDNKLSVITKSEDSVNTSLGIKFEVLGLSFCNLGHFPGFLRDQDKLRYLDLGGNDIHGPILKWVWSTSNETLAYLALHDNHLTSIGDRNSTRSSEISGLFCELSSLQLLDLSNNALSGMKLPECLGTSGLNNSLAVLNMKNNYFHGTIPEFCSRNGNSLLKMVDLSFNKLSGKIPRSMRDCLSLENLNLRNNQLVDSFPSWLGNLPNLRLLVLQSNRLHGEVKDGSTSQGSSFPMLRVIDVSNNNFSGLLPSEYFRNWNAMKIADPGPTSSYLKTKSRFEAMERTWYLEYAYTTTITIKGSQIQYGKIQEVLVVVDFSGNNFRGEIPDSVSSLKGLRVLNLSRNMLSGEIPSSLGSLSKLESLDLSRNSLFGEIPQSLVKLTFLSLLNVSYNSLEGRIPGGNQFGTFTNSSFLGNSKLCGFPLSKKCIKSPESEPQREEDEDEESKSTSFEFSWITIALGFGSGAAIGVVIENSVMEKKRKLWILKKFGRQEVDDGDDETQVESY